MNESVRICVTGLGVVTSLGVGVGETWRRLVSGERGLRHVDLFDSTDQRGSLVGQVCGIDVPPSEKGIVWSRTAAFAELAAREAIAGLGSKRGRLGLIVGGTTGGMLENELPIAAMYPDASNAHPDLARRSHPLSATVDALVFSMGPFARARTVSSACSGGASAVVIGASWLLAGEIDHVLVGGAEALCRLTLTGFNALGVVDPEPCRPFDRTRRGLNLGEGAGFLLLEREETARARKAHIIADLAGWALGSEAHHVTNPEPSGETAARVMSAALERADIAPSQVDWVSAHGTGTPLNDKTESTAILRAIGEHVWVSSNKAQIGHTLGAAGAIEAALAVLAIDRETCPPNVGLTDLDPECPVRILREARRGQIRVCISNAFGFGGMDSTLVFTRPGLGRAHAFSRRTIVITGVATSTIHGLEIGADVSRALAERASSSSEASDEGLDPARARRLDRPARIAVAAARAALEDAEREGRAIDRARAGAVVGTAFGSVQGSAAFVHKLVDKGPRLVPPADFPNLVPSAVAGHASIYLGLRGAAMAVCDLAASADAALATAVDLVSSGDVDIAVSAAVAERGGIIDRVFAPLFGLRVSNRPESATAVVVESEQSARARGAQVRAKIARMEILPFGASLGGMEGDAVFVGDFFEHEAEVKALLSKTSAPIFVCSKGAGRNEVSSGAAICAAAAAISEGEFGSALVLSPRALPSDKEDGWTYAILLVRP